MVSFDPPVLVACLLSSVLPSRLTRVAQKIWPSVALLVRSRIVFGWSSEWRVGIFVGEGEGETLGEGVGAAGAAVGTAVGAGVGVVVGVVVGVAVGMVVGAAVGTAVGARVGIVVGSACPVNTLNCSAVPSVTAYQELCVQ